MNRENKSHIKPVVAIEAATYSVDKEGNGIDLQGFDSVQLSVNVGESGDTLSASVKCELVLQESDDNSTFTDVDAADIVGADAALFALIDEAGKDQALYNVGYIGNKRYVRVFADFTGTHTNGLPLGAQALKGHADIKPV